MSNPIEHLKGGETSVEPTPLPLPQRIAPSPPAPPPPKLPTEPNMGLMPPGDPAPPPPTPPPTPTLTPGAVVLPPSLPGFETQQLQAPAQTGNQQALQIVGPGLQQEIKGLQLESNQRMSGAMDPIEAPRTWEPPDLEGSVTRFGYNSGVLRDSYLQQVKQRNNESERAWLERNMAAIEAMARPETSATANSMEWVNQMMGVSQDGVRNYMGPAVWDSSKGEWRGSAVGGVLYGLGILQNSAMGAFYDVSNIFQNVDRGLRQAYNTFTPPWARDGLKTAMSAMEPLLGSGFFAGAKAVAPALSMSTGKYNDGKSNFIEALRGAQFSFSDKADRGFGQDRDKGFRLSFDLNDYKGGGKNAFGGPKWLNNSKDKPGLDVNPGLLAGLALDVVVGGKIDKAFDALAGKFLPKATVRALSAGPVTTELNGGKKALQAVEPKQLQIPFLSGEYKSAKVKNVPLPANLKAYRVKKPAPPPTSDVQQVLPIGEMMQEYREAAVNSRKGTTVKATPKDYNQKELKLGVKSTPKPPDLTVVDYLPRDKFGDKQLTLKFDALPEAVAPRVIPSSVRMSEMPSVIEGKAYNIAESRVKARLSEIEAQMSNSPDIGRRFSTGGLDPASFRTYKGGKVKLLDIYPARIDLGESDLFHGTQVRSLNVETADPAVGAAYSELGTGIYVTPDKAVAKMGASAAPSAGLPVVPSRSFTEGSYGELHTMVLKDGANIIDGSKVIPGLDKLTKEVAQDFPALRGVNFENKSLVQIYDTAALNETSQAARLQFQQQMAKALREEMIDGVKAGDNIAVYNNDALVQLNKENVTPHINSDPFTERANLEDWGASQIESAISAANALDTEALALSMHLNKLEQGKRDALKEIFKDIEYKGLMDHPDRVPTLDEYSRMTIDHLFDTKVITRANHGQTDQEVLKLVDDVANVAKQRGVKVLFDQKLPDTVGGSYYAESKSIRISETLNTAALNKLETLVHELAHHEVEKLIPYTRGKGITLNELVVDSVGATVASVLAPKYTAASKVGFDWFYELIHSDKSRYRTMRGATSISKDEVLLSHGELINRIATDLIRDIKGADFQPPSLKDLNIFGPASYDTFVQRLHKYDKTIDDAAKSHIVTIDPNLSPALKLQAIATNPVTGKLNTDVLASLHAQFADEVGPLVQKPTKLLEKWAEGLSRSNNPTQKTRKEKALKILDEIRGGGTDYELYHKRLAALDKSGAKQYSPVIDAEIDNYIQLTYCK